MVELAATLFVILIVVYAIAAWFSFDNGYSRKNKPFPIKFLVCYVAILLAADLIANELHWF